MNISVCGCYVSLRTVAGDENVRREEQHMDEEEWVTLNKTEEGEGTRSTPLNTQSVYHISKSK